MRSTSNRQFMARSLTKRVRPVTVIAELEKLNGLEWHLVEGHVHEREHGRQVSKEALVTILRSYLGHGDQKAADIVFMEIIRRLSGTIANKLIKWSSISGSEEEDVRQTVVIALHRFLYSLDPTEELWECNFKTCFDLRLLNILGKLTRTKVSTVALAVTDDDGEAEVEFPDREADAPFKVIEVEEALVHLNKIDPKMGKVFFLKFFNDMPEKEISEVMEVSERTIRNWIVSSRRTLQQFYAEL